MNDSFDLLTDEETQLVVETPEGGFLSDFVQWATRRTDAPEYALQSAGLMALSLACGDTVALPPIFGSKPTYLNLYVMLVGPSTTMRKTTVLNYVKDLLPQTQFGQDYISVLDDVSMQAFNKAAAEAGKAQAPVLLNVDEVAGLFQVVRKRGSYMEGFDKTLMKLYDHTPILVKRTQSEVMATRGAFVNIFAASTPEPLMEALGADDVESGLLPRFIIFDTRGSRRGERRSLMDRMKDTEAWTEDAEVLKDFLKGVAVQRANGVPLKTDQSGLMYFEETSIPITDEALIRIDQLDGRFNDEAVTDATSIGAIKGRAFWHIVKLAGLYAVSRDGRDAEVRLIDVLRAAQLVQTTMRDLLHMQNEVGSSPLERRVRWVENALKASPTRSLPQAFIAETQTLTAKETLDVGQTMHIRGLITSEKNDSGDIVWRLK